MTCSVQRVGHCSIIFVSFLEIFHSEIGIPQIEIGSIGGTIFYYSFFIIDFCLLKIFFLKITIAASNFPSVSLGERCNTYHQKA